jgi:crossover junction endodeoxyribonuclease RuvC
VRVLGLDPGTERTGYGCVSLGPGGPCYETSGVLHLGKGPLPERLARLHAALDQIFAAQQPSSCAIEGLFHHRNARSALLLGHARGVCLLVAAEHGVPVVEYAPATVKQAVTGHGAATKEQVCNMVERVLGLERGDEPHDESDALAIALCHLEAERPLRLVE